MTKIMTDSAPPRAAREASPPTESEMFAIARAQIQHEDNLITQRLSWLMASQSFLFTAYAITLNAPAAPRSALFASQQQVLAAVIPLVASAVCALILVTILAGVGAMAAARVRLCSYSDHATSDRYPPVQGSALTRRLGLCGPVLLPVLFIAVWTSLSLRWVSAAV